jgi:hypothetical protein
MSYHIFPGQIVLRASRDPRGPWSSHVVIFDGINPAHQATADNLKSGHQFVGFKNEEESERKTGPYAPYLIFPWAHFDRSIRLFKIYYTLSTEHPPYNVQLMHSTLRFR